MKHRIKGKKLNRTSSHRKALLKNMSQALIKHEQIITTLVKAKTLKPYFDKLISWTWNLGFWWKFFGFIFVFNASEIFSSLRTLQKNQLIKDTSSKENKQLIIISILCAFVVFFNKNICFSKTHICSKHHV